MKEERGRHQESRRRRWLYLNVGSPSSSSHAYNIVNEWGLSERARSGSWCILTCPMRGWSIFLLLYPFYLPFSYHDYSIYPYFFTLRWLNYLMDHPLWFAGVFPLASGLCPCYICHSLSVLLPPFLSLSLSISLSPSHLSLYIYDLLPCPGDPFIQGFWFHNRPRILSSVFLLSSTICLTYFSATHVIDSRLLLFEYSLQHIRIMKLSRLLWLTMNFATSTSLFTNRDWPILLIPRPPRWPPLARNYTRPKESEVERVALPLRSYILAVPLLRWIYFVSLFKEEVTRQFHPRWATAFGGKMVGGQQSSFLLSVIRRYVLSPVSITFIYEGVCCWPCLYEWGIRGKYERDKARDRRRLTERFLRSRKNIDHTVVHTENTIVDIARLSLCPAPFFTIFPYIKITLFTDTLNLLNLHSTPSPIFIHFIIHRQL